MRYLSLFALLLLFSCSNEKKLYKARFSNGISQIKFLSKKKNNELSYDSTKIQKFKPIQSFELPTLQNQLLTKEQEHKETKMQAVSTLINKENKTTDVQKNTKKHRNPIKIKTLKHTPNILKYSSQNQAGSSIQADTEKTDYFDNTNSLWNTFLATLVVGLIVLLIGVLVKNSIIVIASQVILMISGVFLFMAILAGLLCILTLGLIC